MYSLRRSPHGERGLKFLNLWKSQKLYQSLSSRRAWIEIDGKMICDDDVCGRSPHGERGLKSYQYYFEQVN